MQFDTTLTQSHSASEWPLDLKTNQSYQIYEDISLRHLTTSQSHYPSLKRGSIYAAFSGPVLVLPEKNLSGGGEGDVSDSFPEQRLVIEPTRTFDNKLSSPKSKWLHSSDNFLFVYIYIFLNKMTVFRALMFVSNNFGGVVPKMDLTEDDKNFIALINKELKSYIDDNEKMR